MRVRRLDRWTAIASGRPPPGRDIAIALDPPASSLTVVAIHLCRKAGWGFVTSHRSGEAEDAFIADFAGAMGGSQIKTGLGCHSERIAKYNRLLEIEAELEPLAVFENPLK